MPPLWGLMPVWLRWTRHGQEVWRSLREKSNQNELRWTASWAISAGWRALTSLPYHGLGRRVVPAAPCPVLLSVRAHPKLAAWITAAKNPSGSNGDWSSTSTKSKILQMKTKLTSTVPQVPHLTSDSELSSSARVGALRSLFLWLRGSAPPWLGPGVPLAKDWVLTANFLDESGVSADEKWINFVFMTLHEVREGKTFLLNYINLKILRLTFDGFYSDVAKYGDNNPDRGYSYMTINTKKQKWRKVLWIKMCNSK